MRDSTGPGQQGDTHYSIGEAADLLGISVPTLRLYEREGLILPIRKSSRHRRFTKSDIERVRCIRETINTKKVSIAGIQRLLSLIPCWKIKGCPEDKRKICPASTAADAPCWTVSGREWECASASCRDCEVYTELSDCSTLKRTIVQYTAGNQET